MAIWEQIVHYLADGQRLAFLFVVHSEGSSPGRKGFCMAVTESGEMAGSIGGGIMEQKLVDLARSRLAAGFAPFILRQVHRKDSKTNQSGMICSGEQTIAFYDLDSSHRSVFEEIVSALRVGAVDLVLTNEGISISKAATISSSVYRAGEETWSVRHPLGLAHRAYILGGGHVGLALSAVMRKVGFYVAVLDDRTGLNTMEGNQSAHEKHYVDYASVADLIPEGDHTYVAVVSFGYRTDKEVLKHLAGRRYKYLGMMGSVEKVRKLLEELRSEGVDTAWLASVHTPIGMPIHSKTPEEIAISIAAEIISVKNRP